MKTVVIVAVLALTALAGPPPGRAQETTGVVADTTIPAPVGFVNDRAGLLDDDARAQLEAFLDQVKQKTGAEFALLTVRSSAPFEPSEYKVKVFERWKLGKKGEDNGLLL